VDGDVGGTARRGGRGDRRRGGAADVALEDRVDPVVAGLVSGGRERGGAGVLVDAVAAARRGRQALDRRDAGVLGGEVIRVHGVVAARGVVGDHVGGSRADRDGLGEVRLLPSGGRLVGEGDAAEERSGRGPQRADVRAGVRGGL